HVMLRKLCAGERQLRSLATLLLESRKRHPGASARIGCPGGHHAMSERRNEVSMKDGRIAPHETGSSEPARTKVASALRLPVEFVLLNESWKSKRKEWDMGSRSMKSFCLSLMVIGVAFVAVGCKKAPPITL